MGRLLAVLVSSAIIFTGCASDGDAAPAAERSVDDVSAPAETEAVDRVDVLVTASAEWQCDRQRFAFDSLADVDALLVEVLDRHGVSETEYAAFEADMADDRDLRARVLAAFEADCLS